VNDHNINAPLPNYPQYQPLPPGTELVIEKMHKPLMKLLKQKMMKPRKLSIKAMRRLPKKKIV
jgi:hypothetical protein